MSASGDRRQGAGDSSEPYAELLETDADYDPNCDNPLLQPGSDGLCTAPRERLLSELARRREAGASLRQLRRDAGEIDPFVLW